MRRLSLLAIAALILAPSACSPAAGATDGQDEQTLAAADVRRTGPTVVAEWERNITHVPGALLTPSAFRAGGGLAAALYGQSRYHWKFFLADRGHAGAGGPHTPGQAGFRPPLWERTDVVGITDSAQVWYLDRVTGQVVSEDVGGSGTLIARLGVRGTVQTACALGERAIVYLDAERPGRVFVRNLAAPTPTRVLSLPPGSVDGTDIPWSSLRFGGSLEGGCVLWSARMREVLLVSDSAVRTLGPFVEPLPSGTRPARHAWLSRLRWKMAAEPRRPVGAIDVTSFPGGVAVLFAGRTADSARIVDLYAGTGEYLETMRLPRHTLRIAGTGGRLIALSAQGDSVYIASFVLPAGVRARATADEPAVVAPALHSRRTRPAQSGDATP